MKYFIGFFFLAALGSTITGFFLKPDPLGDTLIGSGVALLFFVVIPLFTNHRWKDRKMSDYLLNKENIEKMRAYNEGKHE